MTPDADPTLERAYPYHSGWKVMGCGVLLFGTLGAAGVALMPFGCEQVRQGRMPLGVALMVIGLFAAPMILMAVVALVAGIRDSISPPMLRVTPTALLLPEGPRGETPLDDSGEPRKDVPPPQPEEIPFTAIKWVRRERMYNPGSDRLLIVHDLAPTTLVIEQYMMYAADFDELETVLRAAIPGAFAPAPPTPPAPTA
jgi:hypothetical protein